MSLRPGTPGSDTPGESRRKPGGRKAQPQGLSLLLEGLLRFFSDLACLGRFEIAVGSAV